MNATIARTRTKRKHAATRAPSFRQSLRRSSVPRRGYFLGLRLYFSLVGASYSGQPAGARERM
jgi:hypothetical protein